MPFESKLNDKTFSIEFDENQDSALINGKKTEFNWDTDSNGRKHLRIGTKLYTVSNVSADGSEITLTLNGKWYTVEVKNEQELLLEKLGFKTHNNTSAGLLKAPMPGKILEILVQSGDDVVQGQPVIILEAMKMENELKAPAAGVVTELFASAGDSVEKNQSLIEIEPRG
jgi:pyruvate carboxylase subunit B